MADWLALVLTDVQLYALVFLLGSIFVAALSDLRYNSAQQEFPEAWLMIVFVVAIYDFYSAVESEEWQFLAIKWGLIILFVILSNSAIGVYFKLAWADLAACAAAACLLPPMLIIVFFILLKLFSFVMKPFLMGFKKKDFYPFIPVVLVGLLSTIAIAIWGVPWVEGVWLLGV
jgi:hypothetical protein